MTVTLVLKDGTHELDSKTITLITERKEDDLLKVLLKDCQPDEKIELKECCVDTIKYYVFMLSGADWVDAMIDYRSSQSGEMTEVTIINKMWTILNELNYLCAIKLPVIKPVPDMLDKISNAPELFRDMLNEYSRDLLDNLHNIFGDSYVIAGSSVLGAAIGENYLKKPTMVDGKEHLADIDIFINIAVFIQCINMMRMFNLLLHTYDVFVTSSETCDSLKNEEKLSQMYGGDVGYIRRWIYWPLFRSAYYVFHKDEMTITHIKKAAQLHLDRMNITSDGEIIDKQLKIIQRRVSGDPYDEKIQNYYTAILFNYMFNKELKCSCISSIKGGVGQYAHTKTTCYELIGDKFRANVVLSSPDHVEDFDLDFCKVGYYDGYISSKHWKSIGNRSMKITSANKDHLLTDKTLRRIKKYQARGFHVIF